MNMNMNDTILIALGEVFAVICLLGSFKVKREQTQMMLFAAFLFSFGVLLLTCGVFLVRSDIPIRLFAGIDSIVFGGVSAGMGAFNIFLFWKDDEAS